MSDVEQELKARIEALTFYGCGDECYEFFDATCRYAYACWSAGSRDWARQVVGWAEVLAKCSENDAEQWEWMKEDTRQGCWER